MFSAFALLALVALVAPSVALSHSNGRGSMSNLQPEPTWIGMGGDDIQDMRFEEPIKTAPSDVAPLSAADLKDSCLFAPESVCIGGSMNGGTSYITAVTKPKGLVTRFFFDDETGIGSSGLFDQVIPSPEAGPGFLSGASAHFTGGKSGGRIKHIPEYSSESISYDFWLFVNDDSIVGFKSILYVGDEKHVAPGLMYHPDHNKFRITVDVVGHRRVEKESRATIPLRRWTHVSLSLSQRVVSLAVNGIVDTEFLLPGPFAMNSGDIFLASNPSAGNGLDCFIDNLQIHSPAASPESIAVCLYSLFLFFLYRCLLLFCHFFLLFIFPFTCCVIGALA